MIDTDERGAKSIKTWCWTSRS